jgi:hypothetical protein
MAQLQRIRRLACVAGYRELHAAGIALTSALARFERALGSPFFVGVVVPVRALGG